MKFSPQQDDALSAVNTWMVSGADPIFRLFGYAGTGKTTLARHIAEGVEGEVLFGAFTGKAAQVLREKGADNARTIHSMIYRPKVRDDDEDDDETEAKGDSPEFTLNRSSPVGKARLIVIDECSMVDEALGKDLLSFGTPILVLGDPGQLPPVSGGGYFTDAEPDVLLTDIHRQAADNPIIRMASTVRAGERLEAGDYGSSRIISKRDLSTEDVEASDQVLVGINRTRARYNARLRELAGFEGTEPVAGDRLVCLRNNAKKGLLNGSLWDVTHAARPKGPAMTLLVKSADETTKGTIKAKVLRDAFTGEAGDVPWRVQRNYDAFDYGYALTVHKAQGSQWDDVVLFDESYAFKEHRERWLYTAITRAAERVTVVR